MNANVGGMVSCRFRGNEITLVVEQSWRGRVLKFKCVYDSDNDENFDEKVYFGEQE